MSHVPEAELHPLFYALECHHRGLSPIPGLELDKELQGILKQSARSNKPLVDPQKRLTHERVQGLMRHVAGCNECQMLVYEKGPVAEPPRTEDDEEQLRLEREREDRKLAIRFWVVGGLGVTSFMSASMCMWKAQIAPRTEVQGERQKGFVGQSELPIHPLQILGFILIIAAAFAFTEAWRVANVIWLDWTRFKESVPVVGKRWAARGKNKKDKTSK